MTWALSDWYAVAFSHAPVSIDIKAFSRVATATAGIRIKEAAITNFVLTLACASLGVPFIADTALLWLALTALSFIVPVVPN